MDQSWIADFWTSLQINLSPIKTLNRFVIKESYYLNSAEAAYVYKNKEKNEILRYLSTFQKFNYLIYYIYL